MRREHCSRSEALDWSTSKCQRSLRPLKLKITALQKALEVSHSVADDLTCWSTVVAQRRSRSTRLVGASSTSNPGTSKVKKYGTNYKPRRDAGMGSQDGLLNAEIFLTGLRFRCSPALGNAYAGVFYAFTSIFDKVVPRSGFPSLVTLAAHAVGRCVHLTGEQFTTEPIPAETWYDAVPGHNRTSLLIGHAVELILAASASVQPMLPAIALVLQDSPLSSRVMTSILELTDLGNCRKSDVDFLLTLARQVKCSCAPTIHFTQTLRSAHITHPAFSALLGLKSSDEMDDHTQALYLKSSDMVYQLFKKKSVLATESEGRHLEVLLSMSRRVLRSRQSWLLPALQTLFCRSQSSALLDEFALAYSLALLCVDTGNLSLIRQIDGINKRLVKMPKRKRDDFLMSLISAFTSENLVEIVECLVGRVDELALSLAGICSATFKEDFVDWANRIEKDIFSVKIGDQGEKYRYEPLLDSWVAKTPGCHKISHPMNKYTLPTEESEDDRSSIDEDGYNADRSGLVSSFAELERDDEDELDMSSTTKILSEILGLATSEKPSDESSSAKLLRRIGRSSNAFASDLSPLSRVQMRCRKSMDPLEVEVKSPSLNRIRKRKSFERLQSTMSEEEDEILHKPVTKRIRLIHDRSGVEENCSPFVSTAARKTAIKGQRELNNLRSSFAQAHKASRKRPSPNLSTSDTEEDEIVAIARSNEPISDLDELSIL